MAVVDKVVPQGRRQAPGSFADVDYRRELPGYQQTCALQSLRDLAATRDQCLIVADGVLVRPRIDQRPEGVRAGYIIEPAFNLPG